jgi:DNA primase catalytic subunit
MAQKRTWDESRSPQWRYLLSKDSQAKRNQQKREEREERVEGELKRGVSKRKRASQERHRENRKLKNKSGKEILYSASPGGNKDRYHDPAFVSRKITPKIFNSEK